MGFIIRLIITALSLGLAAYLIPGVHVSGWGSMFIAAFLLGIVNAIIKPILVLLTFPITLVTLGLFLLVINAAMLGLVAWILPGFSLDGFLPALATWAVISVIGWLVSQIS